MLYLFRDDVAVYSFHGLHTSIGSPPGAATEVNRISWSKRYDDAAFLPAINGYLDTVLSKTVRKFTRSSVDPFKPLSPTASMLMQSLWLGLNSWLNSAGFSLQDFLTASKRTEVPILAMLALFVCKKLFCFTTQWHQIMSFAFWVLLILAWVSLISSSLLWENGLALYRSRHIIWESKSRRNMNCWYAQTTDMNL